MAKYIVASINLEHPLVKCYRCKTLYEPEHAGRKYGSSDIYYEKCPVCGYDDNNYTNVIPLWKYNLIKLFRGGFRKRGEDK